MGLAGLSDATAVDGCTSDDSGTVVVGADVVGDPVVVTITGRPGVSDAVSSTVVTTSICSGTSSDGDDGFASATAPKPAPSAVPAAAASFQLKRVVLMTTPRGDGAGVWSS